MRIISTIFAAFIFVSCMQKPDKKSDIHTSQFDTIKIDYYKYGREKNSEFVIKKKLKQNEYVYIYDELQEENDTLVFNDNNIHLNSFEVDYVNEKLYKINNINYRVRKYIVLYVYGSANLFINDSNDLLLTRTISSNIIVEYHNNSDPDNIQSLIVNDSVFFQPEW